MNFCNNIDFNKADKIMDQKSAATDTLKISSSAIERFYAQYADSVHNVDHMHTKSQSNLHNKMYLDYQAHLLEENQPEFLSRYLGRYIRFEDGQVVDYDEDKAVLLRRAYSSKIKRRLHLVAKVVPESFQPEIHSNDSDDTSEMKERRVLEAISSPSWDFRTASGISRDTGLSESEVMEILNKNRKYVRKALVPSREGHELFASRSKPIGIKEYLALARVLLVKSFY